MAESTVPLNNSNDTTALEQVLENLYAEKEALEPEVIDAKNTLAQDAALDVRITHVKATILAFNPNFEFGDDAEDDDEE